MRIKREKLFVLIVMALLAMLFLAACGDDDKEEKESYTVGIISPIPAAAESVAAFKTEMVARGFTEGENITYYTAINVDELTSQISADKLDLLVVVGGTFSGAPTNTLVLVETFANGKIPMVVMPASGDPLNDANIESISHPGKNLTGLILLDTDAKRFELFVKMLPEEAEQVAVIYDPTNIAGMETLAALGPVAEQAGLEIVSFPVTSAQPESLGQAFADIPEDVDGVFLLKTWGSSPLWYQWAYDRGIPTSQDGRYELAAMPQPLMVYGPSTTQLGARGAHFAYQILNGVKPGELPLEYTEPILTIDMGIAEAMGFVVPETTLGQADEVLHSDPTVYFTESLAAELAALIQPEEGTTGVAHPEGSGACAAQQVTMGGTFTACVSAACDTLIDSPVVSYQERSDVASCTTETLVGTCRTAAFDINYYSGEPSSLRMGCGFMSGEWIEPGS